MSKEEKLNEARSPSQRQKKLKPWEKAWVNPKFVFKNPRCLRSKIPTVPTSAYDDAMNQEKDEEDEDSLSTNDPQNQKTVPLDDVSNPKPKCKSRKEPVVKSRETLKEWKQRRRKFIEKEDREKPLFPTRVGFPYSDLPMEPKRESERVLPNWPPGMTLAEQRHWKAWESK